MDINMELDSEPMDSEMGFTDDEKYQNFLKILATVQYLDDGGRITEDWMEENKALILMYRNWVDDYSQVNREVVDPAFRKCCLEIEILLRQLCHSIHTQRTFDVKIYHMFMRKMKQVVEEVVSEDELSSMLSMLSVA